MRLGGRRLASAALLCMVQLTIGCGSPKDPGSALARYREDVAAALEVDVATMSVYPGFAPAYPPRAQRQAPVEVVNVSLRSFWGFEACGLRALIAGRNTAVARGRSAFQNLPYEHTLLVELSRCRRAVEQQAPFAVVLEDVYRRKLADRDANFWNATFGSTEFVRLFSPSAPLLPLDAASAYVPVAEVETLLDVQRRFGQAGGRLDEAALAAAFQGLEVSGYGGRLLRTLHLANFHLGEVSRLLETQGDFKRLCPMGAPTRRARALNGAFRRHYVRTIQPYLAAVSRGARPWLEAMSTLAFRQRSVMPAGFVPFQARYLDIEDPDGLWQRHLAVTREHAQLWSRFLEQCGIPLV
jgi:hypothetical protein